MLAPITSTSERCASFSKVAEEGTPTGKVLSENELLGI